VVGFMQVYGGVEGGLGYGFVMIGVAVRIVR
jgi:hypothetical protein